jgi:hypothetical protein
VQREALNKSVKAAKNKNYKLQKPKTKQRCRQEIKKKKKKTCDTLRILNAKARWML